MKIYVFGNKDLPDDSIAIKVAEKLEKKLPEIKFEYVDYAEDFLPAEEHVYIMDAAIGINEVKIVENIENISSAPTVGAHDFDLAFQLKFLLKIKKINKFTIFAIPAKEHTQVLFEHVLGLIKKSLVLE